MFKKLNKIQEGPTPRFRLKKGDPVKVITGKEKGKTGKILQLDPKKRVVTIEKVNMVKRHTRPSQKQRQGGIIEKEAPLKISNVMLICRICNKPARLGFKILDDGKKLRYCKKCSEVVDKA